MKTGPSLVLFAVLILLFVFLARQQNFAGLWPCKGFAPCFSGKIDRIVDGDTLVIANKTIRLTLVNAPEKNEEFGREAENFTANLCRVGSVALVDEDDGQTRGSYGRMVAVVYCSGKNLNELLLENNLGAIYISFCKNSEFRDEQWAKHYGC